MSLLGLDIGTTGSKAAVYSLDGRCRATAYREYRLRQPRPGCVELDARHVVDQILSVLREVAVKSRKDPITALSISSMGEALTPVSADRRILGDCIVASMDTRGQEYLDAVADRVGRAAFYGINPNTLAVTYSLPKLMWIRKHEAALYRKAHLFLPWGDLIGYLLGGEAMISYSMANRTLLFDIRKEEWSSVLLKASGLDGDKLPRTVPSGTVAGTVSNEMARRLGLPRGVRIVVGGHDQSCNALGAGIYNHGKAVCGIGTFECITPVYDHIPNLAAVRREGLNVEHHILPGLYVSFIYNQAGSLVRWFRDTFAFAEAGNRTSRQDIYDRLAAEMPKAPTRLLVLPYFEPTGAPRFVADATGVIAGLKTGTTRGEILKGIMEGVTFYFAESMETLRSLKIDTSELVATGGGAKSDAWLQIKADILGVPLLRPKITECGTLGAALLAGLSTGVFKTPAEGVSLFVKVDRRFEPHARRHAVYRQRYGAYRDLFAKAARIATFRDSSSAT